MPGRVDVKITKNNVNPELTDGNIRVLKNKISELNAIYNIIFKHLCTTRFVKSHNYLVEAKKEIHQKFPNLIKDYCLGDNLFGNPMKNPAGECNKPMFNDTKLSSLINSLYNDSLLKKACIYKHTVVGLGFPMHAFVGMPSVSNLPANVQVAGSNSFSNNNQFINLNEIISKKIESNKPTYVCLQQQNEIICKEIKNNKNNKNCDFCDKWTIERNLFRGVLRDLLSTNDPYAILELMSASTHLLPSAILDQKQYHQFNTAYDEYNKQKSI